MRQDELGFFRFVPSLFSVTERITKMHLWARLASSRMASLFFGSLNNLFLRKLFKLYFLLSSHVSVSFVYCSVREHTSSPDYSTSFDRRLYYPVAEDFSLRHCFLDDFIWHNWCVLLKSFWKVLLWDFMLSCIKNCIVLLFKNQ